MIKYEDLLDELHGTQKYFNWYNETKIRDFLCFADDELRHLNYNLRQVDKEIQTQFISTHAKEMIMLSVNITDEMYKGW